MTGPRSFRREHLDHDSSFADPFAGPHRTGGNAMGEGGEGGEHRPRPWVFSRVRLVRGSISIMVLFAHFLDPMSGDGSGFAPDQVHPEGRSADSFDEQQHLADSDRCFQALQASQEVAVGQQPDHGK